MNEIDWEDARHFTALAETLNLARAAADLSTSQVTVMRRVKALEHSLRTTLFLRGRAGHRLTPAGLDLLRAMREAAQLIREGAARVVSRDAAPGGRVRLATTELAANWILLPALPGFLAANPGIQLEIDASPDALSLGADAETLALRFHRPESGALRIKKLGEIAFSLYRLSAALPTAAPDGRYIGWAGAFEEIGLSRWLRRVHAGRPPVVGLTTFDGHLKAVRQGLGASALPDFIAAADPTLARVETEEPRIVLEAWLVVPEQIAALVRVRKVAQFIAAAFPRPPS